VKALKPSSGAGLINTQYTANHRQADEHPISQRGCTGWTRFGCLTISAHCFRGHGRHRSTSYAQAWSPKVNAHYEPRTVLGCLAAQERLGRHRLGIGVTDADRHDPAVTAQAAARCTCTCSPWTRPDTTGAAMNIASHSRQRRDA